MSPYRLMKSSEIDPSPHFRVVSFRRQGIGPGRVQDLGASGSHVGSSPQSIVHQTVSISSKRLTVFCTVHTFPGARSSSDMAVSERFHLSSSLTWTRAFIAARDACYSLYRSVVHSVYVIWFSVCWNPAIPCWGVRRGKVDFRSAGHSWTPVHRGKPR